MRKFTIKDYLPRTLLGRAALIYLVPVLTILGVMSVVFIQRLYEDVSRQMTTVVADEIVVGAPSCCLEKDVAWLDTEAAVLGGSF